MYSFYLLSPKYPYLVLIGYDPSITEAEIKSILLPRLVQLAALALILVLTLWLVRYRIIRPVTHLADAASEIAHGNPDTKIPDIGPVEIANLARQVERIKSYITERRLVENELRAKTMELRKAKESTELADRAKTDFLACVSHELRTPLNAIVGFSEVMKTEVYGAVKNTKYKQYVDDIHTASTGLADIINDILEISKSRNRRHPLKRTQRRHQQSSKQYNPHAFRSRPTSRSKNKVRATGNTSNHSRRRIAHKTSSAQYSLQRH